MLKWNEGDVIRKIRVATGLTLEELAEVAGVSFTTISRIELAATKEPKRDTLLRLSQAFGLTPASLMDAIPKQTITVTPLPRVTQIVTAKEAKQAYEAEQRKKVRRRRRRASAT